MTKHKWNQPNEIPHQGMLQGMKSQKQGTFPIGQSNNYSLQSINFQNNISSLTARGSDSSHFIKLKKKDEFSGDFFKNIMTARGGSII